MKPKRRKPSRFGNPLTLYKIPENSRTLQGKAFTASDRDLKWYRKLNPFRKPFSWKRVGIWAASALGVVLLISASVFAYYVRELPNPKKIQAREVVQSTKILDRNGKELYNIHGEENRTIINGDKISPFVKKATVAVEDASFYNHHGFDVKGLARAVWRRITHKGIAGGGSTITQQYIKNALNTPEKTMDRKLRELILSIEIEQMYSKDEILTGYLNEIPYGSNAYGIEAAAQTYFSKPAKDLTLSEAATLAAIPQAPTYYSPYGTHLDKLFGRKDYILDRMVKTGAISAKEAEEAKKTAPNLESPIFAKQDLQAPHFVFYVREKLIELLDKDPQEAERKLDSEGYIVTTSLDLETQKMAQGIMEEMGPDIIKKYRASNSAMVAVDPSSGEVLAMVGSVSYTESKSGNTNFANALLQPGSSFKPIVYATAFGPDVKRSPASITFDLPTDFGNYEPKNYDGRSRGPITNRNALAQSLNIPAVKNFYLAGVGRSIETAHRMGITTLNRDPKEYGLSLVLGSGEVRPVEMAAAYSVFANGGMKNTLRPILKIEQNGKIFKDFTTNKAEKVLEPEVAWQISSILSDNGARTPVFGRNNSLTLPDRPVAAKTGTTNNNRDAWTVGYTPQIAVAVWVGNNEANKTMTAGADGSYVAAPIWNRFMREYLKDKPVAEFTRPDSLKQVTVDMLSGKLPTDQSPPDQKVTEWLASWQIPKDEDDVHVKARLDRSTGKLATDLTPGDQIEEKYYFTVHSEVPSNPAWEAPVQAWAKANGGSDAPPTEKDDVHVDGNRPSVSFASPKSNEVVNGTFTISVEAGGPYPIASVEFTVNGSSVGKATSAPWSITYDASALPAGTTQIQAVAINSIGLSGSTQVSVFKGNAPVTTSPPGPVTNLQKTDGSKTVPIRLSWLNPTSPSLTGVNIYISDSPNKLGTKKSIPANPGTQGNISTNDLNLGLVPGTYYFTLRTVGSNKEENPTNVQITASISN